MNKSFDEAEAEIQRLMEVAGGSIDAYEPPKTSTPTPNPFGEGDTNENPEPDHGLVVDDPEVYHPSKEEEALFAGGDDGFECGFGLSHLGDGEPSPISDEYVYHNVTERCGELDAVQTAFRRARSSTSAQQVALKSGTYTLGEDSGIGGWSLADTAKGVLYREEVGNLSGHRGKELFIWVQRMTPRGMPDVYYGYIHKGYVFLKKPTK